MPPQNSLVPIIVLAHGSRHPRADGAVSSIARATAKLTGRDVHAAHLDFSPLTLGTVAHLVAAQGHAEAVVVPLLFTRAFHMRYDVPEALAEAEEQTGLTLHLADGLGTGDDMAEVVAEANREAVRSSGADTLVLYSVGSTVPGANEAIVELARGVAKRLGVNAARAAHATGKGGGADTALELAGESGFVAPLFVCPGTLWDLFVERAGDSVGCGEPLVRAVAPLVAARADQTARAERNAHK